MKIIASAPHFFVTDLMESLEFYVDILDFEMPPLWGEPPNFAMPRKDGYIVMLNQQEGIKPNPNGKHHATDAYFWCQEIDEYYSSIKKKGGLKILGIEERPLYGMREFEVYDPNGYKLVFAEDMKKE